MMTFTFNPIPTDAPQWHVKRVNELRARLTDPAHTEVRDGVAYWRSNDRPVPAHVIKQDALGVPSSAQIAADEASTSAFLTEYREARKNYVLSAEERFEMRAAFGPGETVVDIITGQKFRT